MSASTVTGVSPAAPAAPEAAAAAPTTSHPDVAIARRVLHQTWKGAVAIGAVVGATAASSAAAYASLFPTAADRVAVAAVTKTNVGLSMIMGPVDRLDTVAGYTVYKSYASVTTIAAVWALLAGTRLLRGEEDAGRWQLVLAGRTSPVRATAATLVGLAGAVGLVFAVTAACLIAVGAQPEVGFGAGESVLFALAFTVAPAVFVVVGALCSQLAQTRRLATGLSVGVLAVAFVVRMVADSSADLTWLRWLTPLGWIEQVQPLTVNDPWPLLPSALLVAGATAATLALAARRDTGGGLLATDQARPLRPYGLRSTTGLAARLTMPVLVAWGAGLAAGGFLFGTVGKAAVGNFPEGMEDMLANLGAGSVAAGQVRQYLGVVFLLIAGLLTVVTAPQIGAAREEEASGRLGQVLAGRPTRTQWLAGRLVLAAGAVAVLGVVSGVAVWLGVASQGLDVGFWSLVAAGLNTVPLALVVLGIGAFGLAVWPRFTVAVVYVLVTWSFVALFTSALVDRLGWLARLSLYHYLSLAPAEDVDGRGLAITLALAAALLVAAVVAFARRDLATD